MQLRLYWCLPPHQNQLKFQPLHLPTRLKLYTKSAAILVSRWVTDTTPGRAGAYDQMEQLFTNRRIHFCSRRNFRKLFLNRKRPELKKRGCHSNSQNSSVSHWNIRPRALFKPQQERLMGPSHGLLVKTGSSSTPAPSLLCYVHSDTK